MTIRIVSLNCWGGRVHQPLMQFLKDIDADIYCLQEIYMGPLGAADELTYDGENSAADARPCRANLFREIDALLPEHQAFFSPSAQGYLLDSVTTERSQVRYGIATFVRDTLPVIENQSKFVFGGYRAHQWGEPPLPRTAHGVRVYDYENGAPLTVVHMHGLWDRRGKIDTVERRMQARNLVSLVEEMSAPGRERVVVCGDFNVLPDSETLATLTSAGFSELVITRGHTDTRTTLYQKTNRVPWADYMLVSDTVTVEAFDVPATPEVSDHRALILDLA